MEIIATGFLIGIGMIAAVLFVRNIGALTKIAILTILIAAYVVLIEYSGEGPMLTFLILALGTIWGLGKCYERSINADARKMAATHYSIGRPDLDQRR